MKGKRIVRKTEWTEAERARHQEAREQFRSWHPGPAEVLASGAYEGPFPQGLYRELRAVLLELRKTREAAGLSLAELMERSGIDKAALSRLETGQQANPTVDTLYRYAAALGKRLVFAIEDLPVR